MTTYDDVMAELEAAGTEQNRKTYRRHGTPDPLFGVSFAKLGELRKRLKRNQALAEALWASRNADAQILAAMIADPAAMPPAALEAWAAETRFHGLAGYVAELVAGSPHARALAEAWLDRDEELVARMGWTILNLLAQRDATLPDGYFEGYLPRLEAGIHAAPNRVKEAMNLMVIAIGMRSDALEAAAIAAARRIGPVAVDHGDTACKTPDAEPYILKARARQAAKAGPKAPKARAKA